MFDCVGIVGVGLIGTSIGLALKNRGLCETVVGVGRQEATLRRALERGAIDQMALGIGPALGGIDILFLCTPVDRIVSHGLEAAPHLGPRAVMTDVGSTKSRIVRQLSERLGGARNASCSARGTAAFVGSHPLAGSEQRGPDAGRADLFEGKVCIVTPTESTSPAALDRVVACWRALGMQVVQMGPEEHDRVVARTSHLPHLVAVALASLIDAGDRPFVASGWRSTTRIAAGDPELWTAIFEHNREPILDELAGFQGQLDRLREALERQDFVAVQELLVDGKAQRDALGN